jgi:peptide methionine sulfoxide reductase MsrA
MISADQALKGRTEAIPTAPLSFINQRPLKGPYPENLEVAHFAMGRFWEGHDPTQGMRQGNDRASQYRSGIYTRGTAEATAAKATRFTYQKALMTAGRGTITTEISPAGEFYFAEAYHQQYLAKNPHGYCGVGGAGTVCPIGIGVPA